jgi:hypothetical protein
LSEKAISFAGVHSAIAPLDKYNLTSTHPQSFNPQRFRLELS